MEPRVTTALAVAPWVDDRGSNLFTAVVITMSVAAAVLAVW